MKEKAVLLSVAGDIIGKLIVTRDGDWPPVLMAGEDGYIWKGRHYYFQFSRQNTGLWFETGGKRYRVKVVR